MAVIRLKGFKRTSKSFASKRDAADWAERMERDLRAQRDRGGTREDVATIELSQLIERFLADPAVKQLRYLPDLTFLLGEWVNEYGTMRAASFGRLQVTALRDKLLSQGLTPARVNRYVSAMRRAWHWALASGYVLPSAAWPTEVMLKEPAPKDVIATEKEVAELIAACDKANEWLGDLVRFLIGTGARLSDALAVTWRDVDEKHGDVAIRGQKTERPLRVAMLAPAREAVKHAAKVKNIKDPRVFWQFADRMAPRKPWLKARKTFPEHLRFMRLHDCRHLCASLLAANGATDVELAAQLGHSTLQMVKRYSHLRGGHRGAAHDKLDKAFSQ
jgi:integrase